jgi:hypothetical protein
MKDSELRLDEGDYPAKKAKFNKTSTKDMSTQT